MNQPEQFKHWLVVGFTVYSPYQQLILFAAQGVDNTEIGQQLQLSRSRVRLWRQRWQGALELLAAAEAEGLSEEELSRQIIEVLSDDLRLGSPAKFSLEQIVQIVAIACERPEQSERPVNQWTPFELVQECGQTRHCPGDFSPVIKVKHSLASFFRRGLRGALFKTRQRKQPHRSRYWLNANPDDPVAFKQQVNAICQLHSLRSRVTHSRSSCSHHR